MEWSTLLISNTSPSALICAPKWGKPPDFSLNCTSLISLLALIVKCLIGAHDLFENNFIEFVAKYRTVFAERIFRSTLIKPNDEVNKTVERGGP